MSIQYLIFLLIFCPEAPIAGSGPTNWRTVPSHASLSAISSPRTVPQNVHGPKTAPHRVPDGNIVERLSTLLYRWRRCLGSLKSFQSRLTIRANTDVFLWPIVYLFTVSTAQDSIYLGLQNCSVLSLLPEDCLQTPVPVPSFILDPSVNQTSPLTTG